MRPYIIILFGKQLQWKKIAKSRPGKGFIHLLDILHWRIRMQIQNMVQVDCEK